MRVDLVGLDATTSPVLFQQFALALARNASAVTQVNSPLIGYPPTQFGYPSTHLWRLPAWILSLGMLPLEGLGRLLAPANLRLMAISTALALGGVFGFWQGKVATQHLTQMHSRLAGGKAVEIPANWRLTAMVAPTKAAKFNGLFTTRLAGQVKAAMGAKLAKALLAPTMASMVADANAAFALDEESLAIPPQLQTRHLAQQLNQTLQATKLELKTSYEPLFATQVRRHLAAQLAPGMAQWQQIDPTSRGWRAGLAKTVAWFEELQASSVPNWLEGYNQNPMLRDIPLELYLSDTASNKPSSNLATAPITLTTEGWQVAQLPAMKQLLLESPVIKPYGEAVQLLPRVEWDTHKLARIATDISPMNNSPTDTNKWGARGEQGKLVWLQRQARLEQSLAELSTSWYPQGWRAEAAVWSQSPMLLAEIIASLNPEGTALTDSAFKGELAEFRWFVEKWAEAKLTQVSDPKIQSHYLDLLDALYNYTSP